MAYELLTENDKNLIGNYIDYNLGYFSTSLTQLLQPWNEAKSKYLQKIFGDKLIISKNIEYKEGTDQIVSKIINLLNCNDRVMRFYNKLKRAYEKQFDDLPSWQWPYSGHAVWVLFSSFYLADNKLDKAVEIQLGDKLIKACAGSKPLKYIAKIAKYFNIGMEPDEEGITDFEYFRLQHSLCLNQKKLKGELCLSIHPLDYMTMSDNSENWTSCMSWMDCGEYCQGTVEMMNSPCVVVAYLSSSNNTLKYCGCHEWNSKKWRSLFIVDKDFIVSIKGYPYQNNMLTEAAIKELAKLSGWGEDVPVSKYEHNYKEEEIQGKLVNLTFETNTMYNDFGTTDHFIAINPTTDKTVIGEKNKHYCYSGDAECMRCGYHEFGHINSEEGLLECYNCNPADCCDICANCDRSIYEDDAIYVDDDCLCQECYDRLAGNDEVLDIPHYLEDLTPFNFADKEDLKDNVLNTELITYYYYTPLEGGSFWNELFKISSPRKDKNGWYYILKEDLTETGLARFRYYF